MTSVDVLQALAADPTERGLNDLAFEQKLEVLIFPHANDPNAIGVALVRVDDGILQIPYTLVTLGDGWEQFELNQAQTVSEPAEYAAGAARYQAAEQALIACLWHPSPERSRPCPGANSAS